MSFFKDMFSVFNKRDLLFLESYKESNDVYTFLFQKEKDVTWKAGQYGLFSITHKKIKNATRPLSIASAPAENVIKITTRISEEPSEFKEAMLELKPGMTIKMGGPVGSFYPINNGPSLLIAGGIGITPFRAILKQLEGEKRTGEQHIHLLYMDSNKSYLYKDELDGLASNTSINITYVDSRNDLNEEIDKLATLYKDKGNYFIAGPKSMVDSINAHVQNHSIPKRNIKKDAFFGY